MNLSLISGNMELRGRTKHSFYPGRHKGDVHITALHVLHTQIEVRRSASWGSVYGDCSAVLPLPSEMQEANCIGRKSKTFRTTQFLTRVGGAVGKDSRDVTILACPHLRRHLTISRLFSSTRMADLSQWWQTHHQNHGVAFLGWLVTFRTIFG